MHVDAEEDVEKGGADEEKESHKPKETSIHM